MKKHCDDKVYRIGDHFGKIIFLPGILFREPADPARQYGLLPAEGPGALVWRGHAENAGGDAAPASRHNQVRSRW